MSVEFEPVKLGPRRRRVDPVAIGALVVVLAVVAALVKPWDAGSEPAKPGLGLDFVESSAVPSAAPPATASPASSVPSLPRIIQPANSASFATWDRVRAAVQPHDAWGIRAIVGRPSGLLAPAGDLRFDEVWDRLPAAHRTMPTIDVEPDDQTVVAVGITFPPSYTPIDARIWLIRPDRLEWIDTQALDPSPSGGGFLYRIIGADGAVQNWSAGRYRIDVLVDGAVRRYGFTLPNRFEIVPDRSEPVPAPADLIDPAGGALPDLPIGLFVTASGVSIPLPADEGPSLTEAGAWLDVDPGTGRAPRSHVAAVFALAATGLGVMLPPGSVVQRSSVRRLAPEPLPGEPALVKDAATDGRAMAHVLYRPPGGGAWTPGVYRISIVWADTAGLHDRSWHVELRPGPVRELPQMLLAARGFARYAGSSGVVVGTAEPLEGGPRSVAIRLLRPGTDDASVTPGRRPGPCDGVRLDGLDGVLGLAAPVEAPPARVVARAILGAKVPNDQPLLIARGDVPGLTLLAPGRDAMNVAGSSVCLTATPLG